MKKSLFIMVLLILSNMLIAEPTWLSLGEKEQQTPPVMTFTDNGINGLSIQYQFHGVLKTAVKKNDTEYQFIHIPDFGKLGAVGKPALPMRNYPIAVPIGAEVQVDIVRSKYKTFKDYLIHPALEPVPESSDEKTKFVLDDDFYSKDVYYPKNIVSVGDIKIMRGSHFTYIQFCPVQYNPAQKELRIYSQIEVNVTFIGGTDFIDSKQYSKDITRIIKNVVINRKHIPSIEHVPGKLDKAATGGVEPKMLIITHSNFVNAANKLAAWNTRKGIKAIVKTTSEIGSTSSAIKEYVHDTYDEATEKPEYLTILGDHNYVASEWINENNKTFVSDLGYVCMGGSEDYVPEMAYGRISVATASNANKVVDKIMKYQLDPPADADFYSDGLAVAFFEDHEPEEGPGDGYADRRFAQTSEEQRVYLNNLGYDIAFCYYAEMEEYSPTNWNDDIFSWGEAIPEYLEIEYYDWNGNLTQISSAINSGCFLVTHRDHGEHDRWKLPLFTSSNVNNLTNGEEQPIVFSINCHSGDFSESCCFCEAFLRHENGGCVGIIGSTEASYSGYNDAFSEGMVDAIWPGLVPSFPHNPDPEVTSHDPIYEMGNVINQGKLRMLETWLYSTYHRYTYRLFHYFGDPSMEIWTDEPSDFTNVSITVNSSSVAVNAGVSGCTITASSSDNGDNYHSVASDVSSHTFNTSVRPLYITITKHNYVPYTAVTGGNFASNEIWFGTLYVLGDLTINSSKTLTILPQTTIKSKPDVGLTVNGTLDAVGTSSKKITFTRSGASGTWERIYFSSSSSGSIEYSTLEYMYSGLIIYSDDVSIKHNEIKNSSTYGIYLNNTSDTEIKYNKIHDNSSYGLYFWSADAILWYNEIYDNGSYGVGCHFYSSPDFDMGSDYFHYNNIGVYAYYNSHPYFEECSFENNSTYHMKVLSNCQVIAEDNWWGSSPPNANKFYIGSGCSIDYTPWLSSSPLEKKMLSKNSNKNNPGTAEIVSSGYNPGCSIMGNLHQARYLISKEQYKTAQEICKYVIDNYPDTDDVFYALALYCAASKKDNIEPFKAYLTNLVSMNEKKALSAHAEFILAKYDESHKIDKLDQIIKKYPGDPIIEMILFDKFQYYLHEAEDVKAARSIADELDAKFPASVSGMEARLQLGDIENLPRDEELPQEKSPDSDITFSTPDAYSLSGNYPNPFNPSTHIKYALPHLSKVEVAIYNTLGQRVKHYVYDSQEAGEHTLIWHGDNETGQQVSPGIYVCQFRAVSLKETNEVYKHSIKLMLIK